MLRRYIKSWKHFEIISPLSYKSQDPGVNLLLTKLAPARGSIEFPKSSENS